MKAVRIVLLAAAPTVLTVLAMLACSLGGQMEVAATLAPTALPQATAAPPTETPGPSDLELKTLELVQTMAEAGYLSSTSGSFTAIPDFKETWAQLNWYQWWDTGYAPKDFLISAHTEWESASDTADWWNSGCGFVFREQAEDDHFVAYLAMDGWVYLGRVRNGKGANLGYKSYGHVDVPKGEADVVLLLEGSHFHFFVNGERVLSRNDMQDIGGKLGLTLLSGTNKDYGTRCRMEDIALWQIE